MPPVETVIRVENLKICYGDHVAVDQLDLSVRSGEVFGFLGPNGAGKTSTIRSLLGLVRPQSGLVSVLGSTAVARDAEVRAEIGYLPGDLVLYPFLTGQEVLDFFAGLQQREPHQRDAVLAALGFPKPALSRPCSGYSTGMRQMIGIAAALQHEPRLLVLDEPTTGLDPVVRRAFLDLLRAASARGQTVLFSSHVLSEVEACADRLALVYGGRVRLEGSVEEIRSQLPRQVRKKGRDGRWQEFEHEGDVAPLLQQLATEDLLDLEIRTPDLAVLFERLMAEEPAQ